MSLEPMIAPLAEYFGKKVIDRLTKEQPSPGSVRSQSDRIEEALAIHLRKVINWCAQIQFYRMPAARSVDQETVPLTFSATPRKFRRTDARGPAVSEEDLLGDKHLLILGPPGAGKTTTLKRLCRKLLTESPSRTEDQSQVPVVVRLRTFNTSEQIAKPLLRSIAVELGLQIYEVEEQVNVAQPGRPPKLISVKSEVCEGSRLELVVPQVLNELRTTLFLDGLDEVSTSLRNAVEADIRALLEASELYRLVITCRSGEYRTPLGYVAILEVCELDQRDIFALASSWLGTSAEEFMRQAQSAPLLELAQRPLFLAHMLNLYHLGGYLPEQPFEVYELVTLLMIREWDREREIVRKSRYADFGAEKKLRFLAALAFEFTYINKIKVFSERDLLECYRKLRRKFNLPEDEAQLVAQELESHTGIIVEAGSKQYEFSHLTIQEYLAAEYLARSPFPQKKIALYMRQYPAPLAIATVLSTEPAAWLAGVLLNSTLIAEGGGENLLVFLDRLQRENPIFVRSDALGFCVLGLCFRAAAETVLHYRQQILEHLARILESPAARLSFVDVACLRYSITLDEPGSEYLFAGRRDELDGIDDTPYEIDLPPSGRILKSWVESQFAGRELMFDGYSLVKRR